ncbi:MAG: hypothetical protein KF861_06250 [Planctomycetaceae bacterium]|nr:hypothetical protein [Planctomycetaceae bacterium]
MPDSRAASPATSRQRIATRAVWSLMLLVILSSWSCRGKSSEEAADPTVTEADDAVTSEQCVRTLENIKDGLSPERFGVSSDPGVLVDTLNSWFAQCANAETFSVSEDDAALRAKLLPESVYAQTIRERFTDHDANYVRNILLIRDMMQATLQNERTDVERAVSLFYKIVHSIDLRDLGPIPPSFGPYETATLGWGGAADRTWLYGLMLRQLRLDAVVIRPRAADGDAADAFLVGVIVPEDGVYLFDFKLGLPITSPSEDDNLPLPRNPMTLAAARQDDAVFRQYDIRGNKYPLTADQLSDVDVLAIGESSTWSPRLGALQAALTEPLELFDGLSSNTLREHGLIERLTSAGQDGLWTADHVGIWDYPETVFRNVSQRGPEVQQQLQLQEAILEGPVNITVEQRGDQLQPIVQKPKQNLRQARIRHLQGDYKPALDVYLRTRLAPAQVLDQPIPGNVYGADSASYWGALAQFDQSDFTVASESVEHYFRKPGPWAGAARILRAHSLAISEEPQLRDAADFLAREPLRSPQRLGNQWLVRRWRRMARELEEPAPAVDEESPATDAATPSADDVPKSTPEDLPVGEQPGDPRFEDASSETPTPADAPANPQPESTETPQPEEKEAVPESTDVPPTSS